MLEVLSKKQSKFNELFLSSPILEDFDIDPSMSVLGGNSLANGKVLQLLSVVKHTN